MKKAAQASMGLALGAVMVWLLFRGTDWGEVSEAIAGIHLGWFLVAQIPLWLSFPIRVQRWSYIVRASGPASFRTLFSATQIGFLANFTLPGRAGEVIRALVLTRLTRIEFTKAFAMVALDRVTDLFGLIAIMMVALFAYQPTEAVVIPGETFSLSNDITFSIEQYRGGAAAVGVFLVAVIGVFVLLYTSRAFVLRMSGAVLGLVSKKLAARVHGLLDSFAEGMRIFRSPGDMAKALALSMVTWGMALLCLVGMMKAFHIEVPWYTAFVMQSILAVFISAPGAPGFVGQYHIPIVITLVMLIDIDVDHAKAIAIVIHLINLPPIALAGIWCLATEKLGLLQLQSEASKKAG